jgi:hypothetical protein
MIVSIKSTDFDIQFPLYQWQRAALVHVKWTLENDWPMQIFKEKITSFSYSHTQKY